MPDDERKNKAIEQDEDEDATVGSDDDGPEEPSDEAEPTQDPAAHRVAEALGVDGADGARGEVTAQPTESEVAPNRAARRQEAALRRKKRKATGAKEAEEERAEALLPSDKNARAKELLKRRREQASTARPVQLLPGEMVDDALARSSSAIGKWFRQNFSVIQWVILGAIAAGGGYVFYASQVEKKAGTASAELYAGVAAARGRVMADDKRSDDEKEFDTAKVFKTAEARADNELAAFRKVVADYPNTGAAILGKLGEGGAFLEKRDWDPALAAFSAVASSSLAVADPDVKGRALEGLGFAKEGKGDLTGALAAFKDLEGVDARGFKELGMYHQGRVLLAKGDKEKAKDLLKQVHDRLEQPTEGRPLRYVQQMTDEVLRKIDPNLVPVKTPLGPNGKGAPALTKEQLEKLIQMKRQDLEKKPGEEKH